MFKVIPLRGNGKNIIRFTINSLNSVPKANAHAVAASGHGAVVDRQVAYPRIGSREIVGFGRTGEPEYFDANDLPLPSVRWAEDSAEIKKLREKAKGDWGNLSVEEKKALYRADFRITLAELNAPTGEWKFTTGLLLGLMGLSVWVYYYVSKNIYDYPRPPSASHEHQARMLERMIAEGQGRVHGVSAKWDYEKGDWKKN